MSDLPKKTAVVVGGSGQIGRVIVDYFLSAGCQVAIVSRGKTEGIFQSTHAEHARFFCADIGDERQVHEVFASILDAFDHIDFFIYAAGIEADMDVPISSYSLHSWQQTFRVYVTGLFLCIREALQHLGIGGHFIVLSSAVTRFHEGSLPPLYIGHYASAKAAVNELCKWVKREFHERGMLLSRIAPAAVDVPFHRNAPQYRKPAAMIPLDILVSTIVDAALREVEVDEEIV